jgi:serine protease
MMRTAWLVGGVMAMQLFGCMSGEIDTSTGNDTPTWEEFEASTFKDSDGVYIVNGDEPVESVKLLREFYDRLYHSDGALIVNRNGSSDDKWSNTAKLNITYCVSSSSFGGNYNTMVSTMNAATAAWEATSNINFVHLTQFDSSCNAAQSGVVFDVRQVSGQSYLARAFFPAQGRSTRNVLVDSSSFGNISPWTLKGILIHELGHTLGFRHEHTRPEAGTCFEDNNWRALTTYDGSSVMHYPQCNGDQQGDLVITSKDREGAAALYGAPGSDPGPGPGPGNPTTENFQGSAPFNAFAQLKSAGFNVKAGTTFKVVQGGSGDPDLYVRFGSAPTTGTYNCRPYLDGPNETCELTVPAGTTKAYVSIRGYTRNSTYTAAVTYTAP